MLMIPELAMPKCHSVTTICKGKRIEWSDYEDVKNFFLRKMMCTEGE